MPILRVPLKALTITGLSGSFSPPWMSLEGLCHALNGAVGYENAYLKYKSPWVAFITSSRK